MRIKMICCVIVCILSMAFTPAQELLQENENDVDAKALGMPITIKDKITFIGLGKTPWWIVRLILPEGHYSKDNLEKIFQYYSEKYPGNKTILRVQVYADDETYEREKKTTTWHLPGAPEEKSSTQDELPAKKRWSLAHAIYERLCYNEFYYYSPDLENPDKQERVILKGKSQTLTVIPHDCK